MLKPRCIENLPSTTSQLRVQSTIPTGGTKLKGNKKEQDGTYSQMDWRGVSVSILLKNECNARNFEVCEQISHAKKRQSMNNDI